jgi:Alginate lyase
LDKRLASLMGKRRFLWHIPIATLIFVSCGVAANAAKLSQCNGSTGYEKVSGANTFLWRPEWLALQKQRLATYGAAAKSLRKAADAAVTRGPYSVTAKTKTPQSADKHDYYTIGPYWWPDASKADGLPYIRRDGETNPESRGPEFDKDRLQRFADDVQILALAAHHLGDRRYGEHSAKLLRAWFLDPDTRMNPNLNFAQAVPGINSGRAEGIIELIAMPQVVESIGLLKASGALKPEEIAGLQAWFSELTEWMQTSANGKDEAAKSNNHGIYYDYLLTHFALFAGKEDLARTTAGAFVNMRIAKQMAKDGSLPEELARTRSLHYSYFALQAAARMATISECVGVDLWRAKTADGLGLDTGLTYLTRYSPDWRDWPHPETALAETKKTAALRRLAVEPLRMMAWGRGDQQYELHAQQLSAEDESNYWLSVYETGVSAEK